MVNDLQHILQALLPQQNAAAASIYGGQSDVMNAYFGAPTSAMPPLVAHQAQMSNILRAAQQKAVEGGMDARLNHASRMTGISRSLLAQGTTLFPTFQMGGFREDMYSGGASMALSRNPLRFLQEGPEAQAEMIERVTQGIYSRMTDSRTGAPIDSLKGIRGTQDMSTVLNFARETGQIAYKTNDIAGMSDDDLVGAAEDTIKRFDTILEAGRKVFGPNAKTADILRRMRAAGGQINSQDDANRVATLATNIANTALITEGSVEGAFRAQENMTQSLRGMGVSFNVASAISGEGLQAAMRGFRSGTKSLGNLNTKLGTNFDMISVEDLHAVAVQQQMSFLGTREARRSMSTGWLESQGIGTDRAAGIEAIFGGDLHKIMPGDLLTKITEESAGRVSLQAGMERMDDMFAKGVVRGDKDLFKSYTTQRFGSDPEKAKQIREAIASNDVDTLKNLLGFNVTQTMLADMKISEAYALNDFMTYGTADNAMTVDTEGDVLGEPPRASDDILNNANRRAMRRRYDKVKGVLEETVDAEDISVQKVDESFYKAWSKRTDEDLAGIGVVRSLNEEGNMEYNRYVSTDDHAPLSEEVTAALDKVNKSTEVKSRDMEEFVDMLQEMLMKIFPAIAKTFAEESRT